MESKSNFKDHFSSVAAEYAKYRPDYPDELFMYLASKCSKTRKVWDCATGSGQAARSLAQYFEKVIATDASKNQLKHATKHEQIEYLVCPAEDTPLSKNSVDLITVAQALHWFDHERFFKEVRRVSKTNGVLAVWSYGLAEISPKIDQIISQYYNDIVGPYWPEERKYIEEQYQTISFPFKKIESPGFFMEKKWNLDQLKSYLGTWSATKKYKLEKNSDPVDKIDKPLKQLFSGSISVRWPLILMVFQINPQLT